MNKKSQDLTNIAGVEDLSLENAAAFAGGAVTFYDGRNQTGISLTLGGGRADLGVFGFNNRASSLFITEGQTWRFWVNKNYTGQAITLRGGEHNLFDLFNNNIESFSRIA